MGLFKRISATFMVPGAVLAGTMLLAACADPPPLYVDGAWIRLSADPKATPSAGYFTVHGGQVEVQLRGILSDRVQRIEMHESMTKDGMASMKPVDAVDIPAKTDVAFAPGGKHIMLFGVNAAEARDGKIPLTFLFSNGDRIVVDTVLQKTGEDAPAPAGNAAEHAGH